MNQLICTKCKSPLRYISSISVDWNDPRKITQYASCDYCEGIHILEFQMTGGRFERRRSDKRMKYERRDIVKTSPLRAKVVSSE